MSDWTVDLELDDGTSSKFWRARVDGKTLYVNYGKIGANGQTQVKDLADPTSAKAEYDKLVRDKRKKGYLDRGAAAPAGSAPVDDDDDDDDEPATVPAKRLPGKPGAGKPAPADPAPAGKPAPAVPSVPGHRMVLDAGNRKVETTLYLDGTTLRMDALESYATPEAAKKAFERLKKMLGGEGYQDR